MPKPTSDQFRTIYHISESDQPPHLVAHPYYKYVNEGGPRRQGSSDVLFGTEEKNLSLGSRRRFVHAYKVPESAISQELYTDDDLDTNDPLVFPHWQKRPQLWQQVPANRLDALRRKQVIRFTNLGEGVPTTKGKVHWTLGYILPKPHMEELGIEYGGVTERAPEVEESREDVQQRIRKSYGEDII